MKQSKCILILFATLAATVAAQTPEKGAIGGAEQPSAIGKPANDLDHMVLKEAVDASRDRADPGIADYMKCLMEASDVILDGGLSAGTSEYRSKYDIVHVDQQRGLISYRMVFYAYPGGAHGSEAVFLGTIDTKTARKLSVADVIPEDKRDEALGRIRKAVADQIGGEDNLSGNVTLTENFCVAADGLHFVFREYEVAAYCHGTIEVVIPDYADNSTEAVESPDGTVVRKSVVTTTPFTHERRAALWSDAWGGLRVDWTAVADWPTGNSPAAKAARIWIEERLRNGRDPFDGDPADWDAMTRFHGGRFLAENGRKHIEAEWRGPNGEETEPRTGMPDVDPGADVFLEDRPCWFSRHSAIVEYEDEHIVSYRSGFYGFHVGNATSAAHVRCATFRKSDGKVLGWDAFTDTNAVSQFVREQMIEKFGQGADLYGTGTPIPDAPLFTSDGFRLFWGDYSIVKPHVYEEDGAFPSLFIQWQSKNADIDPSRGSFMPGDHEASANYLTHETLIDLGFVKPLSHDWPGCFCREFRLPNNGPLGAVYYRISADGRKQLLAEQWGGGSDDTMFFDVDGDGVPELVCQNHAGMGWHPSVSIYRLTSDGSEVCEGEELLKALAKNIGFKLEDIPWAGNLTLELDKETKSLSGGEFARWIATEPDGKADENTPRVVERVFLERLRSIQLPFQSFEPTLCRPEDL